MTALERLVENAGDALGPGAAFGLPPTAAGATRRAELEALSRARDGFTAFDDALWVLPLSAPAAPIDQMRLNAGTWKSSYWHLCQGYWFFAADALGDLFALSGDTVVRFASETGIVEPFAATLEGWAAAILADPANETGWPFMKAWREANGPLRAGWRLSGRQPFVLDGGFELANLQAVDLRDLLAFRGRLATRIHDLPPGARVELA
jgi:hypothetical protein